MSEIFSPRTEKNKSILGLRLKLIDQGYEPIPILASEKKPLIDGWTKGEMTPERIVLLSQTPLWSARQRRWLPDHLSTGLRTGHLAGVDIDLIDPLHAEAVQILTEEYLGTSPFHRVGSKGCMLSYHNPGTTVGKMIVANTAGKTLVEIFGQGNQYVAYGDHPVTKQPYRWTNGHEPLTLRLDELPRVTADQLRALHQELILWLTALGYAVRGVVKEYDAAPMPPPSDLKDADHVTDLFVRLIPGHSSRSASGYYNFHCPYDLRHLRSGITVKYDGGFYFKCFNTACPYHDATGWSPGGGIGPRTRDLYVLMGGDPDDLPRWKPEINFTGYDCVEEMLRDRERLKRLQAQKPSTSITRSLGL